MNKYKHLSKDLLRQLYSCFSGAFSCQFFVGYYLKKWSYFFHLSEIKKRLQNSFTCSIVYGIFFYEKRQQNISDQKIDSRFPYIRVTYIQLALIIRRFLDVIKTCQTYNGFDLTAYSFTLKYILHEKVQEVQVTRTDLQVQ